MADIIFPGEVPDADLGAGWLPQNVNISMWKGDKQEYIIALTDTNGAAIALAGQTPKAQIRQNFSSSTAYSFTCTIQNSNQVRIYMPSSVSSTLIPGDYVWDFQLTDVNGDTRTYVAGDVVVYGEVTQ